MKKILIGLLLIIHSQSYAQCDKIIELSFIKQIESAGDSLAFNKQDGGSRGLYQINPVGLKDYNNFHKVKYTLEDLFKSKVNTQIARWMFEVRIPAILRYYGYKNTIENQIISYNAGAYWLGKKEIPKITKDYIAKYKKLCNKSRLRVALVKQF